MDTEDPKKKLCACMGFDGFHRGDCPHKIIVLPDLEICNHCGDPILENERHLEIEGTCECLVEMESGVTPIEFLALMGVVGVLLFISYSIVY